MKLFNAFLLLFAAGLISVQHDELGKQLTYTHDGLFIVFLMLCGLCLANLIAHFGR